MGLEIPIHSNTDLVDKQAERCYKTDIPHSNRSRRMRQQEERRAGREGTEENNGKTKEKKPEVKTEMTSNTQHVILLTKKYLHQSIFQNRHLL